MSYGTKTLNTEYSEMQNLTEQQIQWPSQLDSSLFVLLLFLLLLLFYPQHQASPKCIID